MAAALIVTGLLRQPYAAEQIFEPWVGAQWIIHRVRSEKEHAPIDTDHFAMLIGLFQPVKGAVLVAEDGVGFRQIPGQIGLLGLLQVLPIRTVTSTSAEAKPLAETWVL